MRCILSIILLLLLSIPVYAAEKVAIKWTAPTMYTDQTLIGSETISYRVYCGTASGVYVKNTLISSGTSTALYGVACATSGTLYFSVTAIVAGIESDYSTENSILVSGNRFWDVLPRPNKPTGIMFN